MKKENRLVIGDASWAADLPQWLLNEIKAERIMYGLGQFINPDCIKVGNAEIVAYLMTASLRSPIGSNYTNIYIYCAAELFKKLDKELPDMFQEALTKGLSIDEKRELKELRSMIYDKRGGKISHPILDFMKGFSKLCTNKQSIIDKRFEKTEQFELDFNIYD